MALATREGARVLHLADLVGTITPGKAADITVVSLESWSMMPGDDPVARVVHGGSAVRCPPCDRERSTRGGRRRAHDDRSGSAANQDRRILAGDPRENGTPMSVRPILVFGDARLEAPNAPVETFDAALASLVDDLFETGWSAPGLGLAAPQIGANLRLATVDLSVGKDPSQKIVLANPTITETSGRISLEEGCLSFPGLFTTLSRPREVVVTAQDEHGEPSRDRGLRPARSGHLSRDRPPRWAPPRPPPARHQEEDVPQTRRQDEEDGSLARVTEFSILNSQFLITSHRSQRRLRCN